MHSFLFCGLLLTHQRCAYNCQFKLKSLINKNYDKSASLTTNNYLNQCIHNFVRGQEDVPDHVLLAK